MGEKLKTKENQELERVRKLFIDPSAERNEVLEELASASLVVMQEIYRSGGNIEKMDRKVTEWFRESLNSDGTRKVLAEILIRETKTRRFDHKFFGQIHPHGNEIGILSNLVAAWMNTNTIVKEVSIAENAMEKEALDWFAKLFGYNLEEYSGNIVTGGTEANEIALWIARDKKIQELKDMDKWIPGMTLHVVGTNMGHYSFDKICYKLGMESLKLIKADHGDDFRSSASNMRRKIRDENIDPDTIISVVALAGETETGMVDDLNELADLAKEWGTWYHVDAAYGGPFIIVKKELFSGLERADSITVDPHKMLYTPYPSGIILIKNKVNRVLIERGMRDNAGYLAPNAVRAARVEESDKNRNFGFSRSSGSMGSHGAISTWATIQAFGEKGIGALLNHTIELTNYAHNLVNISNVLEALHEPDTNTLIISIPEGLLNSTDRKKVVSEARIATEEQGYYISSDDTLLEKNKPVFRFVAMHPYSTSNEVSELIGILHDTIASKVK